jgi:hypothetical protein
VPYVRAGLCNSCRMAKARGRGRDDWLKGLVMSIVSSLLLFQNKALAQLDYSNVASRMLENRLNLMVMRPGFPRAGRHSDNFCLFEHKWHRMSSCLGFLFQAGQLAFQQDSVTLRI